MEEKEISKNRRDTWDPEEKPQNASNSRGRKKGKTVQGQ